MLVLLFPAGTLKNRGSGRNRVPVHPYLLMTKVLARRWSIFNLFLIVPTTATYCRILPTVDFPCLQITNIIPGLHRGFTARFTVFTLSVCRYVWWHFKCKQWPQDWIWTPPSIPSSHAWVALIWRENKQGVKHTFDMTWSRKIRKISSLICFHLAGIEQIRYKMHCRGLYQEITAGMPFSENIQVQNQENTLELGGDRFWGMINYECYDFLF
jgi:hypothetical protein